MTPADLARLHAAAFSATRAWGTDEIADLLSSPLVFAITRENGFALGRVVADESELLTLAVHPVARRQGLGRALLSAYEAESRARGATSAFLDVAADNTPAIALYAAQGYVETGRRPDYYTRTDGSRADACLMARPLT